MTPFQTAVGTPNQVGTQSLRAVPRTHEFGLLAPYHNHTPRGHFGSSRQRLISSADFIRGNAA